MYSFPNSAYWYLIGGPGPSSSATSINVAGTFNFKSCVFSATPKWKDDKREKSLEKSNYILSKYYLQKTPIYIIIQSLDHVWGDKKIEV